LGGPNDTEFCNAGIVCEGAVDTSRSCSASSPPTDAGGDSGG
jgi:hypothetical protein